MRRPPPAARLTASLVLLSTMALALMLAGTAASGTISFSPDTPAGELAGVEAAMIGQRDALPPGAARTQLTRALQSMDWATADVHFTDQGLLSYSNDGADALRDLRTTIGRLTWVDDGQLIFEQYVVAIAATLAQIAHHRFDEVSAYIASLDLPPDILADNAATLRRALYDINLGDAMTADRVQAAALYRQAWTRLDRMTPGRGFDQVTRLLLGGTGEGDPDSIPAGIAEAFRVDGPYDPGPTPLENGPANRIRVYLGPQPAPESLVVGIYADDGGHPGALLARGRSSLPLTADAYNVVLLTDSVPIVFPDVYWIAILAPPGEVGTLHFLDSNRFPLPGRAETSVAQGLTDLPSAWGAGVDSGDSTLLAEALT